MKKLVFILWILFTFSLYEVIAQNAPIITAGTKVSNGSTTIVPITALGFNNIGSCNLKLTYDPAIATATAANSGPLLGGFLSTNLTVAGVITIGWFTYPGVTLPDNTVIFNITFSKVTNGTSALTWVDDGYSCIYYDGNWNPLNDLPASSYYIDGSLAFQVTNVPITIAPEIIANPGESINVPIKISDFINIGAYTLTMQYSSSVLSYQSFTNDSGFPGLTVNGVTAGTITATGLVPPGGSGITMADNSILFTIQFNYLGGSSGLNWNDNGNSCEYKDYPDLNPLNDSPTSSFYINGSVNEIGLRLMLKLFLDGSFLNGEMTTSLKDLSLIPLSQPYSGFPWNYNGSETVTSIPENVVDWVLVDLRESAGDASSATSDKSIAKRAAFILKDGLIKDLDGINNLEFQVSLNDNLYIVIYHRNHLSVISSNPVPMLSGIGNYDFSSGEFQVLGGNLGHKEISPGVWGMVAGDGNGDKFINVTDKSAVWGISVGNVGYLSGDFNLNSQVNNQDKNDKWLLNTSYQSQVPN